MRALSLSKNEGPCSRCRRNIVSLLILIIQTKNNALKGSIEDLLSTLPEREKKIITYRFGINGEMPKTLEQLGEIMGYSKERIRQLEDSALSKIREKKELQHFRDFIED